MLLQWCTLEPSGPSGLAALRFASPVRIKSISIFPTDYQPFEKSPEIVSRTEPEAFFLELYFNAHPVSQPNSKEKVKPSNALMPTVIAYAGGRMDFPVHMNLETATRLMVVKGSFESVSMAIYGDVSSELSPPPASYELRQLPSINPQSLHPSLDPSAFDDPTKLANQLLQLIPHAPPLPLVVRLIFCLKPSDEDWDSPDFPYLHSELDEYSEDSDIQQAVTMVSRPVADNTAEAVLRSFSKKVARSIEMKDDDTGYHISELLSQVACQHPELARALLNDIDLANIFNSTRLDEDTLERLLEAVSNNDIARAFDVPWFRGVLTSISGGGSSGRKVRSLARQLLARLEGLSHLEDAILNTQGAFSAAALAIKDVSSQQHSFGTWLTCMITHRDLLDKLSETSPPTDPMHPILPLFSTYKGTVSHEQFIAFLRAVIGVSCVLSVYAWADSLPVKRCRERALGIIRLWQSVDGYREILSHLLLSKQMVYRLKCMLGDDIPTNSGIHAEHILVNLAKDPQAIVYPHLVDCILALQPPYYYITQEELTAMQEAAELVEDGLQGAVDYLMQPLVQPPSPKSIRALRVALTIVSQELDEYDEQDVLEEFWDKGNCSLQACLADVYAELNEEICRHFTVKPSISLPSDTIPELFRASDETTAIMLRLAPHYPLPGRIIRNFVSSAANLFASTDLIYVVYAQSSPTCAAAQLSRQSCIDAVRSLAASPSEAIGGPTNGEIILRTLLLHGLQYGDNDPAHHLLQSFHLIDHLLPLPDDEAASAEWTRRILPNVLRELWAFCSVLDTESKAHFVRRLIGLDRDVTGIGDWMLQQELKDLIKVLSSLENPDATPQYQLMRQFQVTLSIRFLHSLISSSSSVSKWCIGVLTTDLDTAHLFATCLEKFGALNIISSQFRKIIDVIALEPEKFADEIKLPVALTLLRMCQFEEVTSLGINASMSQASTILLTLPPYLVKAQRTAYEVSALLYLLSNSPHLIEGDIPDGLLGLLEWLESSDDPAATIIQGISSSTFSSLCEKFAPLLPDDRQTVLELLQARFKFPAQEGVARSPIVLPDQVELSVQDLQNLMHAPMPTPSTPPKRALNQDALSAVTISPPTAVIRSPAATGLTKTYANNDFRQLRQTPSARQNTSRLPSMHVDDFENAASSPTLLPLPMPVPIPLAAGPSTIPFAAAAHASLSPVFKLL